ncbi:MAG TPA: flagellar hook-associated protein FlgL [Polyangiales bacterium]|jgi:flagellar hook-associated protein 3 FlgL
MRVTDGMFFDNMKRNVAARQSDYMTAQERAASGLKVENPSDDPVAFSSALNETTNLNRATGYQRSIDQAKPVLDTADSALGQIDDVMGQIRDIAVQGANDPLTASDRQTLSQQLDSLRDQLVSLGNSQSGDVYVFGGYKNGTPPYDATGTYTGDTNQVQVAVSRGVTLSTSVTGDKIFGTAGNDVFTTISNLQTALASNDGANISSQLTDIDAKLETVRTAHSEIGVQMNASDIAETVAQRNQDQATKNHSSLVDADAAGAYTDLARAQTALSAAIQIAAQLPPPGLVEKSR